jgi:hypothetical protein
MLTHLCRARQEGIHQDLASSRNWFLDHGSVVITWTTFWAETDRIIGVIGYIVKLVHIPVNNILVGGS